MVYIHRDICELTDSGRGHTQRYMETHSKGRKRSVNTQRYLRKVRNSELTN